MIDKLYKCGSIISVVNTIICKTVYAANEEGVVGYNEPNMAGYFFRIIFSLTAVIFLTYLILKFLKKQNRLKQNQKSWIKVHDYQGLGLNKGFYLIELFSVICVVGMSENGFSIIKEIDPESEEWEQVKEELDNGMTNSFGLKNMLHRQTNSSGFGKQLKEQLNRTQDLYRQITRGDHNEK